MDVGLAVGGHHLQMHHARTTRPAWFASAALFPIPSDFMVIF